MAITRGQCQKDGLDTPVFYDSCKPNSHFFAKIGFCQHTGEMHNSKQYFHKEYVHLHLPWHHEDSHVEHTHHRRSGDQPGPDRGWKTHLPLQSLAFSCSKHLDAPQHQGSYLKMYPSYWVARQQQRFCDSQ